jgi:hypothetical protein
MALTVENCHKKKGRIHGFQGLFGCSDVCFLLDGIAVVVGTEVVKTEEVGRHVAALDNVVLVGVVVVDGLVVFLGCVLGTLSGQVPVGFCLEFEP